MHVFLLISIFLFVVATLMRFDPKRLAEQRKKKPESSSLPPAKRGKKKDVAISTSVFPRPALASASAALVINAASVSALPLPVPSLMSRGHW